MADATSGVSLKLKVTKRSKLDESREEGESSKESFSRFCNVCNEGFVSGKALGGHMRIHPQAVKKVAGELCSNGGGSGNHVCCLCQRVFPSIKSLSGHMRTHPGRNWRGTQPPQEPPQGTNRHSSSSTVSGAESPECKFDDSSNASFDRMLEASTTLLSISITVATEANISQDSGDPRLTRRIKRKSDSFEPDSSEEARSVSRNEEDDSPRRKNNPDKRSCRKRSISDSETKEAVTGDVKKTTEKQPENCKVHRCSSCSRNFSTHQALGGHRSGRKKGNNTCKGESSSERRSEKEKKIPDFDLNEPPSRKEEEEEAENR